MERTSAISAIFIRDTCFDFDSFEAESIFFKLNKLKWKHYLKNIRIVYM